MYDPILGRFLSPDPFVQMPDYSQSFNRYSYCLNNPLKYTDPDGEIVWFVPVIVGAVIGAYAGASIQSGTAAFWNWNSNAWQGAIAGSLGSGIAGVGWSALYGAGTGAFTGAAGALISGGDPKRGALTGAIAGGLWGTLTSLSQRNYQISVFRKGAVELGVNGEDAVPATDQFLSDAQKAWYKNAPMDKIKVFTVENVPENHLTGESGLITNNAPAKTVPLSTLKGTTRFLTGYSNVYFNKNLAFNSAKQLFFTMGHEFVHVSQFAYLGSIGAASSILKQPGFIDMLEFHAYSYQHLLGGTHLSSFTPDMVRTLSTQYPNYFNALGYLNFGWTSSANYIYPY
jgi:hypothetical protein